VGGCVRVKGQGRAAAFTRGGIMRYEMGKLRERMGAVSRD